MNVVICHMQTLEKNMFSSVSSLIFCDFFVLKYGKFQTQNINGDISITNRSMITIEKKIFC